jgi:hypothetical protein
MRFGRCNQSSIEMQHGMGDYLRNGAKNTGTLLKKAGDPLIKRELIE